MSERIFRYVVALGVLGVWILVLQNANLFSRATPDTVRVVGPIAVEGVVEISNTVDVSGTVDVNLAAVVGRELVESQNGMYIGVSSVDNKIIPIHWGDISIAP